MPNLDGSLSETFSIWLRTYRVKHHLTQLQMAVRLGCPQSVVSRLESGVHEPSIETLRKIATALGVKISIRLNHDLRTRLSITKIRSSN